MGIMVYSSLWWCRIYIINGRFSFRGPSFQGAVVFSGDLNRVPSLEV